MATGSVKWFNPTKGYGFIQPQGGGRDVFVHISAVERAGLSTLNEGQQIEYEIEENRGKTSAVNLKVKSDLFASFGRSCGDALGVPLSTRWRCKGRRQAKRAGDIARPISTAPCVGWRMRDALIFARS